MAREGVERFPRRIYPLDPRELTQEQLAVAFAMTSRRPEPFDEIARTVSREKAADFHERWVVGYGHASVAEHAVLHMAVENISRLACDALEDNRLASYTEKSSRYQVIERGAYYVPPELDAHPQLKGLFVLSCDSLLETYHTLLERTVSYLATVWPRKESEKEAAYGLRLRREATDSCRFVLPAATLTNVGVTMNARVMEHAIAKLLSSDLEEERQIGEALREEGRRITPTLIKYANYNAFIAQTRQAGERQYGDWQVPMLEGASTVRLLHYDPQAEAKVAAGFLYRFSHQAYDAVWRRVLAMSNEERRAVIAEAFSSLGPFDTPGREAELADYTFEFVMDYGAYREFKRHRMQTYIPQPLTVAHGYVMPQLIADAGLAPMMAEAMARLETAHRSVAEVSLRVAQYLVSHAHRRRVLAQMDLRECYHVFKLRTGPQAHFSMRQVMEQALALCKEVHPTLFGYLQRCTQ